MTKSRAELWDDIALMKVLLETSKHKIIGDMDMVGPGHDDMDYNQDVRRARAKLEQLAYKDIDALLELIDELKVTAPMMPYSPNFTMLFVGEDKASFHCTECGANVFRKLSDHKYRCNGCQTTFYGA